MNPFGGLDYFLLLLLVLLPVVICGLKGKQLRVCGMLVCAVMLLAIFRTLHALLLLAAFWVWQTALTFWYLYLRKRAKKALVFHLAVALSLLPLLLVKLSLWVEPLRALSMLGLSYLSFRAVQPLIDIYDGRITELNLLDLSYFVLFFPSVSSGPLDRYRRFETDLHKMRTGEEYRALLRDGLWRLMTGAFYNFVIGNLIWKFWLSGLPEHGFWATVSYMYGYTFFMFFNFAGYSRMAVGTAYLLGIEQPDNFDLPFLSLDMKDFWSRWHISLSTYLRDYVYTRFCMAALRGKWFKGRRTSSYLGYALTMLLMGAWHGLTPGYLTRSTRALKHSRKTRRQRGRCGWQPSICSASACCCSLGDSFRRKFTMLEEIIAVLNDITGADAGEITPETELFEEGLLDSFGLVELLVRLEQFGKTLDVAELTREEISTPAKIAALLA